MTVSSCVDVVYTDENIHFIKGEAVMRVAIVYPEVYEIARLGETRKEFPPFGVLYLAAVMEANGVEVVVFKATNETVGFDFRGFGCVAISTPSSATYGTLKRVRFSSRYDANTLIVVGGVHATIYPEETCTELDCDAVCVGEGEVTILELIQGGKYQDFSRVHGVCYRKGGVVVFSRPRDLIGDLDTLPLPARHLLDEADLIMNNRLSNTVLRMAHIMISRGCPFSCYFCATKQVLPRYRSGLNVRKELEHLIACYDIEGFAIVDDNFIVSRKKVVEICDAIVDLNLKWSALSRVDTVNRKLLEHMKKAGCLEVKFGVESGSETILRAMNKNITREKIVKAITAAYMLGINVKVFLVHGFPGENHKTTRETIELLRNLKPMITRVSLFRFTPLPGSYVYEHHTEYNLRGTKYDVDWDGDWSKYHIHHNYRHWWGDEHQFGELQEAYDELNTLVNTNWP